VSEFRRGDTQNLTEAVLLCKQKTFWACTVTLDKAGRSNVAIMAIKTSSLTLINFN
jgi:hypothetical protein